MDDLEALMLRIAGQGFGAKISTYHSAPREVRFCATIWKAGEEGKTTCANADTMLIAMRQCVRNAQKRYPDLEI